MPSAFFAIHTKSILKNLERSSAKANPQKASENKENYMLFSFGTTVKPSRETAIKTPLLYTTSTGYGFDFGSVSNVKIAPALRTVH